MFCYAQTPQTCVNRNETIMAICKRISKFKVIPFCHSPSRSLLEHYHTRSLFMYSIILFSKQPAWTIFFCPFKFIIQSV